MRKSISLFILLFFATSCSISEKRAPGRELISKPELKEVEFHKNIFENLTKKFEELQNRMLTVLTQIAEKKASIEYLQKELASIQIVHIKKKEEIIKATLNSHQKEIKTLEERKNGLENQFQYTQKEISTLSNKLVRIEQKIREKESEKNEKESEKNLRIQNANSIRSELEEFHTRLKLEEEEKVREQEILNRKIREEKEALEISIHLTKMKELNKKLTDLIELKHNFLIIAKKEHKEAVKEEKKRLIDEYTNSEKEKSKNSALLAIEQHKSENRKSVLKDMQSQLLNKIQEENRLKTKYSKQKSIMSFSF
ncbi:MAG: hypothetical protein ACRCTJ_00265 [Brevinema sp.]